MTSAAARVATIADARDTACEPRCASCRYRADDRHSLEQSIPGLTVFSSGFGASVAASRLCRLHDQLVSPDDTCVRFQPIPSH
ncbi:hypothetical protein PQQ51_24500 [Paraburkholderia xenovorans]|uniref:hypothetical protein n=1 Tax=Paraburkholderia xenovorans TaxID=36873 RepID=UPI0038B6C6C1